MSPKILSHELKPHLFHDLCATVLLQLPKIYKKESDLLDTWKDPMVRANPFWMCFFNYIHKKKKNTLYEVAL